MNAANGPSRCDRYVIVFRTWLQHDDGSLCGSKGRIVVQVLVDFSPPRPKTISFLTVGSSSRDTSAPVGEFDVDLRMGLKVQPPGGLTFAPSVHRQSDQVGAVLEIANDHAVLPAGSAPGGDETQSSPLVRLRMPQPQAVTGHTKKSPMGLPEEPDEPAGRKRRFLLGHNSHEKAPFPFRSTKAHRRQIEPKAPPIRARLQTEKRHRRTNEKSSDSGDEPLVSVMGRTYVR